MISSLRKKKVEGEFIDFDELISGFHTSRAVLPGEGTILMQ